MRVREFAIISRDRHTARLESASENNTISARSIVAMLRGGGAGHSWPTTPSHRG